jgi:hypothetical protein
MSYTGEISRDHPTCFLFVIDQSGSMDEKIGSGCSKADFVADVLNKTLATLVANCTKADGVMSDAGSGEPATRDISALCFLAFSVRKPLRGRPTHIGMACRSVLTT